MIMYTSSVVSYLQPSSLAHKLRKRREVLVDRLTESRLEYMKYILVVFRQKATIYVLVAIIMTFPFKGSV